MDESEALKWWDEFMKLDTESVSIIEKMLKGDKKLETVHEVKMLLKSKEVKDGP